MMGELERKARAAVRRLVKKAGAAVTFGEAPKSHVIVLASGGKIGRVYYPKSGSVAGLPAIIGRVRRCLDSLGVETEVPAVSAPKVRAKARKPETIEDRVRALEVRVADLERMMVRAA